MFSVRVHRILPIVSHGCICSCCLYLECHLSSSSHSLSLLRVCLAITSKISLCRSFFVLYHSITESLELEGTSEGRLVQLPGNEQGHPQLDEVAQGLIQPYLESLQGRGINHITGQPVTVPYHSHCRRFFPYIQPKSTLFELEAIFPCSITTDPAKQSPSFL